MDNPTAPENNKHHTSTYRSQEEFLDDLLGRGKGDPDFYPIPGEDSAIVTWRYTPPEDEVPF